MLFVAHALDKPGGLDDRLAARPDHLAYWEQNDAALVLAGPYLDENERPCGSMLVVSAPDHAAARALIENDPYAARGVFEAVTVRPWNWVLKRPEAL